MPSPLTITQNGWGWCERGWNKCEVWAAPWGKAPTDRDILEKGLKFLCSCSTDLQCGKEYQGRCFCGNPKFATAHPSEDPRAAGQHNDINRP